MDKPIRILHVLTSMSLAGAESLLMNYYRAINRDKIQFDFAVSTTEKCAYDNEIISLGGRIIHYPRYNGINHLTYMKWWSEFFSEHLEYGIVHGHIGSTAAIYLNIAKHYGCYVIAHSHSTTEQKSLHAFLYEIYSYPTRYIADYFFGCSKEALVSRYGKRIAENSQISSILKNAIDGSRFQYNPVLRKKTREKLNINQDVLVVGTVGRLTPPKNPFFIVEIIKELRAITPNFKFLWVGDGEMKANICSDLEKEEVISNVIMAGTTNKVEEMYMAMDIFIFPSLWEGLGNVAIEAQASGLYVLCSEYVPREASISDLCEFLPVNNARLWAEKIISFDFSERKDMKMVVKEKGYDIQSTAAALQEFYIKTSSSLRER